MLPPPLQEKSKSPPAGPFSSPLLPPTTVPKYAPRSSSSAACLLLDPGKTVGWSTGAGAFLPPSSLRKSEPTHPPPHTHTTIGQLDRPPRLPRRSPTAVEEAQEEFVDKDRTDSGDRLPRLPDQDGVLGSVAALDLDLDVTSSVGPRSRRNR